MPILKSFCTLWWVRLFPLTSYGAAFPITGPAGSGAFGTEVKFLPNGNFVVTDPRYDAPGPLVDAGAVYLYDGSTMEVISVLTGTHPDDLVGFGGITVLGNGGFLVNSWAWHDGRGAVTLVSGTAGLPGGQITPENSLVGANPGDRVGIGWEEQGNYGVIKVSGITLLTNGSYLVASPYWNGNRGAVTWCGISPARTGVVSVANSVTGPVAQDLVGTGAIAALANGNWVVSSPRWNGGRGAVTWGSGTTGRAVAVSELNSLTGTRPTIQDPYTQGDWVGSEGVAALANGNYVVKSSSWNQYRGAATWGDGSTGLTGAVSAANSLTGSSRLDRVGLFVIPLRNGHYVVPAVGWNDDRGAVTWGSGTAGISGAVSPSNSMVGLRSGDRVGDGGVTVLPNGNYVVTSLSNRGAVTWVNGAVGLSGGIGENSLTGGDYDYVGSGGVQVLANGNYVVASPSWGGGKGAATWVNASTGISGLVSPANSLTGTQVPDRIGTVTPLTNGNYVVSSLTWGGSRGSATWGNGATGTVGSVSQANSLVGAQVNDRVGAGGVWPLTNGHFVVSSLYWNEVRGAVTWGDGSAGVSGVVSAENSLTGYLPNDFVGFTVAERAGTPAIPGVQALSNGNFVVRSGLRSKGAATWCRGTVAPVGLISEADSLIGAEGEAVGIGGIKALANGHYLVISPYSEVVASEYRGVLTPGDGVAGTRGLATAANSISYLNSYSIHPPRLAEDPVRHRIIVQKYDSTQITVIDYRASMKVTGNHLPVTQGSPVPSATNHTDFGVVATGGVGLSRSFAVDNDGVSELHLPGVPRVTLDGAEAADFAVTGQPESPLAGGGTAAFEVKFTPSTSGLRKAWVNIARDPAEGAPYRFAIQGTGGTIYESWRSTFLETATANAGALEDFDSDGVPNLLEFAFGTRPDQPSSGPASLVYHGELTGGGILQAGGQPICLAGSGGKEALYVRRMDHAAAGLNFSPQFSADLILWQDNAIGHRVIAGTGELQLIAVPYPPDQAMRFFRVKVSSQTN